MSTSETTETKWEDYVPENFDIHLSETYPWIESGDKKKIWTLIDGEIYVGTPETKMETKTTIKRQMSKRQMSTIQKNGTQMRFVHATFVAPLKKCFIEESQFVCNLLLLHIIRKQEEETHCCLDQGCFSEWA